MRFLPGMMASLLLPLLAPAGALAAGNIEVAAFVNVHGGVFELNARTLFPLSDDVRRALTDGATVNFDLQVVVEKQRRYWLNSTLVDVILRRELTWNAVSKRYVVKDVDRGELDAYVALDEALVAVGVVTGWPVVVEPQLDSDSNYVIRVRAGYRRGRLPDALRALIFWSDGWNRRSEWISWILPR